MALRKRGRSNSPSMNTLLKSKSGEERKKKWSILSAVVVIAIVLSSYLILKNVRTEDEEITTVDTGFPKKVHAKPKRFQNSAEAENSFYENTLKNPRYYAVMSIDKSIYSPGDMVYVKVNLFSTSDMRPPLRTQVSARYASSMRLKMRLPSGTKKNILHLKLDSQTDYAIYVGNFQLRHSDLGGEYILETEGLNVNNVMVSPCKRRFEVRILSTLRPKLSMRLDFAENGYSLGDIVIAELQNVTRLDTGKLAIGAKVSVTATLGNEIIYSQNTLTVDSIGKCKIDFSLKKDGAFHPYDSALLSAVVLDGDIVQTISKTIPLVRNLDIQIFPESGDLISSSRSSKENIINRIYIEATNPFTAEPADVQGEIVEVGTTEKVVATLQTIHEGRGKSSGFPVFPGRSYKFRITKPDLAKNEIPLPKSSSLPRSGLISLVKTTQDDGKLLFENGEDIKVRVYANAGAWKIVLYHDDQALDSETFAFSKTMSKVISLHAPPDGKGSGVLRLTLYSDPEDEKYPVAERLIFRKPAYQLRVDIKAVNGINSDGTSSPRKRVQLEFSSVAVYLGNNPVLMNEKPKQAIIGIRVTDKGKLDLLEQRKLPPLLPTAAFLEGQTLSLKDPEVYLRNNSHMDLLLSTQGWRRFAYSNISNFLKKDGNELSKRLNMLGINRKYELFRARFYADAMPEVAFAKANFALMNQRGDHKDVQDMKMQDGVGLDLNLDDADTVKPAFIVNGDNDDMRFVSPVSHPPKQDVFRRVYAFKADPEMKRRSAFEETIYWNPAITTKLDENSGRYIALVEFDLNDATTTFSIDADAISDSMLGEGHSLIISNKAIEVGMDLPFECQAGDELWVPITFNLNDRSNKGAEISLLYTEESEARAKSFSLVESVTENHEIVRLTKSNGSKDIARFTLPPEVKSLRFYLPIKIGQPAFSSTTRTENYDVNLVLSGRLDPSSLRSDGEISDSLMTKTRILPRGFAIIEGSGGILTATSKGNWSLILPSDTIKNSFVKIEVSAFLSPVGQLMDVVKSLLREPCGCFEQTSSTTYPMIIALRYLVSLRSNDPNVLSMIKEARRLLKIGYSKLISFETPKGGFSWFGDAPGHEALTAYGLVQYSEMGKAELGLDGLVDGSMLGRTKKWLLKRRNGMGNFSLSTRALDSFGRAPQFTSNAYILWSLAKAGIVSWNTVRIELQYLGRAGSSKVDPYFKALSTIILFEYPEYGDKRAAHDSSRDLVDLQNKTSGCIRTDMEYSTITMSSGFSRTIETTALSVMAWIRFARSSNDKEILLNMNQAIQCISQSSRGGRYLSTQSTALALEAIVEYMEFMKDTAPRHGSLVININHSGLTKERISFSSEDFKPTLKKILSIPAKGREMIKMEISLEADSEFKVPYTISTEYYVETPPTNSYKLNLSTSLTKAEVLEGEVTTLNVVLENRNRSESLQMTIARIGIPSGTEVRMEKLLEMKATKALDSFEVTSSFVTFYWLGLEAKKIIRIPLELTAKIPGRYQAPASSTYLYYEDEHKVFVHGVSLKILPKLPEMLLLPRDEY